MAFDMNNFVIDRIIRGVAISHDDTKGNPVLFSINQIQNASLNCASESTDAVDAMGTPIATFYRAKTAEFSAENALFDMNLMATQLGTSKKVASADKKVIVPAMETIELSDSEQVKDGKYVLKHVPTADSIPSEIYELNPDSTFGKKYKKETAATADAFAYVAEEHAIKLPTGMASDSQMFVMYEYESEQAVEVVNSAKNFPVGCKFVMEVLGCDVCNQTDLVYAYLVFNNAKLSPDFDWSIATDGSHPFSMKAQQDYCDREKRLFSIIIPGDQE